MQGLGLIEKVAQKHHQQEHAAKGQNPWFGNCQQFSIVVRIVQCSIEGFAHPHPTGQGDHGQRPNKAHTEYRNHQPPGEEELLLARAKPIEYPGIDNGIVEGEGDLQQQQHQGEPGGLQAGPAGHYRQASRTTPQGNGQVAPQLFGNHHSAAANSC